MCVNEFKDPCFICNCQGTCNIISYWLRIICIDCHLLFPLAALCGLKWLETSMVILIPHPVHILLYFLCVCDSKDSHIQRHAFYSCFSILSFLVQFGHKYLTKKKQHTLKWKHHHFDNIFIIGCIQSCNFENFQCSQWWKCHNHNILISV